MSPGSNKHARFHTSAVNGHSLRFKYSATAMSWVTIIWSMSAAISLTLGAIHVVVWLQDRKAWENLMFSITALAVAGIAACEMGLMHTDSIERFGALMRWGHVPLFVLVAGIVGFVSLYFGTGRWWLGCAAVGIRLVSLILNFIFEPNLNYREISALKQVAFLGDRVWVVAQSVPSHLTRIVELSSLLVLIFVVDAFLTLWRKGGREARRRAAVVGGSITVFIIVAAVIGSLIHTGVLHTPYLVSLPFLAIVLAMGYELSRDVVHAARMADELRENAESMSLAAGAAQLALWRWDIPRDVVWFSPDGRRLYGIPEGDVISLPRFLDTLHPDDREATRQAVMRSLEGNGAFRAEYRVVLPGGVVRWIGARGKVEFNGSSAPVRMRGVSLDITERKVVELEAGQHRAELTHLTRVTTLSELSGSLAHELNQPLAIILSNAQAAQRLLVQAPPDVAEVRDILTDIVAEDRRAGEVIQRLRALLKRGEPVQLPLSLNDVITEVLHLINAELIGRGVTVVCDLAADLPQISGDRVQLQQVVLNLILNGTDAMSANAPGARRLHVTTARHDNAVRASVHDEGCGLPADVERIFEPFFTTKAKGLGLGLAICRSIIGAHQGRLWAEPCPERGAIFYLEVPAMQTSPT
jgi:two-component system sensor kinase FixL